MSNDIRREIFNNLNLKDTDELLEMWQTNDRVDWTDEAFDMAGEILQARLGVAPPQNEPVLEHVKKSKFVEDNAEALQEIDADQAPPVFYQPKQVLWLDTWLNLAAVAAVVVAVVTSLLHMGSTQNMISYFIQDESGVWNFISWMITIVFYILAILFQSIIAYYPLKALGTVLKILMAMEFNSRGVKRNDG